MPEGRALERLGRGTGVFSLSGEEACKKNMGTWQLLCACMSTSPFNKDMTISSIFKANLTDYI